MCPLFISLCKSASAFGKTPGVPPVPGAGLGWNDPPDKPIGEGIATPGNPTTTPQIASPVSGIDSSWDTPQTSSVPPVAGAGLGWGGMTESKPIGEGVATPDNSTGIQSPAPSSPGSGIDSSWSTPQVEGVPPVAGAGADWVEGAPKPAPFGEGIATPTNPTGPASGPAPLSPEQEFAKQHATPFDPNSRVDRAKMVELKQQMGLDGSWDQPQVAQAAPPAPEVPQAPTSTPVQQEPPTLASPPPEPAAQAPLVDPSWGSVETAAPAPQDFLSQIPVDEGPMFNPGPTPAAPQAPAPAVAPPAAPAASQPSAPAAQPPPASPPRDPGPMYNPGPSQPTHSNAVQRHADAYNSYHSGQSSDDQRASALSEMDTSYTQGKADQERYFRAIDNTAMRRLKSSNPELYQRYVEHYKNLYGGPAAIDINFSARGGRPLTTSAPVTNRNYRVGGIGPNGGRVIGVRPG